MTAAGIAAALGEAYRAGPWWRCRCPAHDSRGPSLAVRDGERRLIVHCHAGCPPEAVRDEIRRRGLDPDPSLSPHVGGANDANDANEIARGMRDREFRTACALDRWRHETRPASGSVVERYWRRRGLTLAIPDTIRASAGWLRHRESGESRPAMVALVEHVERGAVAVHATFLAPDGSAKASLAPSRKCFGPVAGGAARLGRVVADDWLIVGEGIETTATVMQAIGAPGWAALSDHGIERLVLPAIAKRVLIAADNDENGAGGRAAERAAQRWLAEGRTVRIAMPPTAGTDFNDLLTRGKHAVRPG